jgi:uncharacterized protein (DUF2147 family)
MKTRHLASIIIFFILIGIQYLYAQSENAILGTWLNTEKSAKIEILKNGSNYIGKIIWLEPDGRDPKMILDAKNSNPKLQQRPILGMTILEDLTYKDGTWEGGKIYDPESGKTYSCELKLKNRQVLEVKGYLGFSWVGRTVEWTKIN